MKYGDKRDYPKISIYVRGKYVATTTWARTLRIAKAAYFEKNHGVHADLIKCEFETPRGKR
jgi:hypothetical protein